MEISPDTPAMMLKGMGGANIGVWAAHGEGQVLFPSEEVRQQVLAKNLAPVRCGWGQKRGQDGSPLASSPACLP